MLKKHLSLLLAVTIIFLSVSSFSVYAESSDDSVASDAAETSEAVLSDDASDGMREKSDIVDTGANESCTYFNGIWYDENGYTLMVPGDTHDFSIPTSYKNISSDISVECGTPSVASCTYKTNNVFTIKAKATGTSTIHASVSSSYTYYDSNLKRNITNSQTDYLDTGVRVVNPVTSLDLPKSVDMIEGDATRLSPTSEPNSAYSRGASKIKYESSDTKVVKVNRMTGELTAQGPGTATVTATASVSGYPSARTTVNVTSAFQTANSGSGVTITKYIGNKSTLKIPTSLKDKTVNRISDSAFKGVTSLTEVTVPSTVNQIGAFAFSGCSNLKSVFIPRSVTQIGSSAFSGCASNLVIRCAYDSAAYWYAKNNGIPYSLYSFMIDYLTEEHTSDSSLWGGRYLYDYGGSASQLTLTNTKTNVSNYTDAYGTYHILSGAFRNNKNIKMVTISEGGVLSIGDNAFSGCTNLEILKVNSTDVIFGEDVVDKSVIIIGYKGSTAEGYAISHGNPFMNWLDFSFRSDDSVSIKALSDPYVENNTLVFPESIGKHKVTEIVHSNITYPKANTLILPDTVERIGDEAFSLSNFTRAYLGNNLKEIGDKAFQTSSLRSVELPDTLVNLGESVFDYCSNLRTVKVGNGLTSIGGFYKCSNLKQVILGSNVKTIKQDAFWQCSSLEYINLDNVSSSIGNRAFWGCTKLRWFHLSDQLKTVGYSAFQGADVSGVIIPKSVTSIGEAAFGYTDSNAFRSYHRDHNKKISGFKINGYSGTAAQTYANNNGFSFIDLSSGREPELKNYGSITKEVYIRDSRKQLYCYTTKEDGTPTCSMPGFKMDNLVTTNCWYIKFDERHEIVSFYDGNSNLIYGPVNIKNYQYTDIIMSGDKITQYGDISYVYEEEPVPVTHVALNKSSAELDVNDQLSLSATVSPSNADNKNVSWSSDNTAVAKVSDGTVTAVGPGTAYITALASNNLFALCKVTVTEKPSVIPVTKVSVKPNTATIKIDETEQLTATAEPSNATDKTIIWKSEDEKIAKVDKNGVVTGIAKGTVIITASCGDKSDYCTVKVEENKPEFEYRLLNDGTAELTTYNGNSPNIVIPEKIDGKTVTSIGKALFYMDESIESVKLPETITNIDEYSFCQCTNLKTINLPDSVTTIKKYAFFEDTYLDCTVLPSELKEIGYAAFSYCKTINNDVVLPEKLTKIGEYAFFDTIYYESVTIPKSVTSIGNYAFGYCYDTDTVYRTSGFVIKGYANSEAQRYATDSGFTFEKLDVEPTQKPLPASPIPVLTDTDEGVLVTWQGIEGVSKYRVYYLDENDSVLKVLATVNDTTYLDTEAVAGETHRYSVGFLWDEGYWYGGGSRCISHTYNPPKVILGDVDGDGKVSIADVTFICRSQSGISLPFTLNTRAADVSGNGNITVLDATLIQRWLAGMRTFGSIGKLQ